MKKLQMNEVRVVVNCQYFENYAWESGGDAWKPKGLHQFAFNIDSDEWFYCSDEAVKPMVERIVANKCNAHSRFQVVGYETIFEEMEDISGEVNMLCKEEYKRVNDELLDSIIP
jgi:hypothetical protein